MSEWIATPESSNVAGFGYNATTMILTVEFKNRKRYEYLSVPEYVASQMKTAQSTGKYLNAEIKGKFQYREI